MNYAEQLRLLAAQYVGASRDALHIAANLIEVGRPVPGDIAAICADAFAFKQDKWGK